MRPRPRPKRLPPTPLKRFGIATRARPSAGPFSHGRLPRRTGSRASRTGAVQTALAFIIAAVAEIAGCYAFWAHVRLGRSAWWLGPGVLSLILFAFALTFVQADAAGRAYAAYGGIYIAASIVWLWSVEGVRPDRWGHRRNGHLPLRNGGDPLRTQIRLTLSGERTGATGCARLKLPPRTS